MWDEVKRNFLSVSSIVFGWHKLDMMLRKVFIEVTGYSKINGTRVQASFGDGLEQSLGAGGWVDMEGILGQAMEEENLNLHMG